MLIIPNSGSEINCFKMKSSLAAMNFYNTRLSLSVGKRSHRSVRCYRVSFRNCIRIKLHGEVEKKLTNKYKRRKVEKSSFPWKIYVTALYGKSAVE